MNALSRSSSRLHFHSHSRSMRAPRCNDRHGTEYAASASGKQQRSSIKATRAAHSNAIVAAGGCCARTETDAVVLAAAAILPLSLSLPFLSCSATAIKLELENRNAAAEKIARK